MTSPHTTITPCPACGSSHSITISRHDGKTGAPLTVVQCSACGLGRQDPMPSAEALAQWYSTQYRQDYKTSTTPKLTHVLRAGRIALARWNWALGQVPSFAPLRTLDVGASSGEFVYLMQTRGAQALGLEPHQGYSAYARDTLGIDLLTGALQQKIDELPKGQYDLVSMFHVLEHLTDPVAALRQLARLLRPGGMLLLEVPDNAQLSAPNNTFFRAHTLYFTAQALTQVAQAAQLEVVAHNFAAKSNLLVLLQPSAVATTPAWKSDNALMEAQKKRGWFHYLYQRMKIGYLPKRIAARQKEKAFAQQFDHARALLDHIYRLPAA